MPKVPQPKTVVRNPDATPLEVITEKEILVSILRSVNTIKVIVVIYFLLSILGVLMIVVSASESSDSGF